MQLSFTIGNLGQNLRVYIPPSSASSSAAPPAPQTEDAQSRLNNERVAALQKALTDVEHLFATTSVTRSDGIASVISFAGLGLGTTQSATTFNSSEQINTATTSYTPFGPVFGGSGNSDALPTLSGVYDGSNGDQTLTFKVSRGGTHGSDRLRVQMFDDQGNKLQTIKVNKNDPLDKEYSLVNGLVFTLGAGDLVKNDTFTLDVSATTPSAVNPDKAFDGTRNDRPNFDDGVSVSAGSFDVNGFTINVNADDTINTVLDRINNSGAGVTAVFDSNNEVVQITRQALGSAHDITLNNDSSGFLAAVKLSGNATPGLDVEADTVLAATPTFGGVSSGTITINETAIAVDTAADTLNDLVERINQADAGVTASLIHDGQRFLLTADEEGQAIALDDGSTGLFPALDINPTTYRAKATNGFSSSRAYDIADDVENIVTTLNEIFDDLDNPYPLDSSLESLRTSLQSSANSFGEIQEDGRVDSDIGLVFDPDRDETRLSQFVEFDRGDLVRTLQQHIERARGYFEGDGGASGFVAQLRSALSGYSNSAGSSSSGLFLDLYA